MPHKGYKQTEEHKKMGGNSRKFKGTIKERFLQHVNKDYQNECWEWIAVKNNGGYGMFSLPARRKISAHRFSYKIHKGKIPKGMFVCHTCDNRSCVNPEHLWLGTAKDNMQDMIKKGRAVNNIKISQKHVLYIRKNANKLTQKEFAEKFGISQGHVSAILLRKKRK